MEPAIPVHTLNASHFQAARSFVFFIFFFGTGAALKTLNLVSTANSQAAISQSVPLFRANLASGHIQAFSAGISFIGKALGILTGFTGTEHQSQANDNN